MQASTAPGFSSRGHGAIGFAAAVGRAFTWHALLATQTIAAIIALTNWLELGGGATPGLLVRMLCTQALTAILVVLAGLAGDEAVRRGWGVLRAFAVTLLGVAAMNAAVQWLLHSVFNDIGGSQWRAVLANDFFSVGAIWGIVLLVYLNRQQAARLLAHLRADELERVAAEQRVMASHLKGIEARVDWPAILCQLSEIRYRYACLRESADDRLENLILTLQSSVARARMPGDKDCARDAMPP